MIYKNVNTNLIAKGFNELMRYRLNSIEEVVNEGFNVLGNSIKMGVFTFFYENSVKEAERFICVEEYKNKFNNLIKVAKEKNYEGKIKNDLKGLDKDVGEILEATIKILKKDKQGGGK